MKTKQVKIGNQNVTIAKGATQVKVTWDNGKTSIAKIDNVDTLADAGEFSKVEFISGKGKTAKIVKTVLGVVILPELPAAQVEVKPTAPLANMGAIANCTTRDIMTVSPEGAKLVWHKNYNIVENHNPRNCALSLWDGDVIELPMPSGQPSGVNVLVASDDKKRIGRSFEDSYAVFKNMMLIELAEKVLAIAEKLGIKLELATSGSVTNRTKTYMSFRILNAGEFAISGRKFLAAIDLLNHFGGFGKVIVCNSNVFICCANTFRYAETDDSGAFRFAVSHRKNMVEMLNAAIAMLPAAIDSSIKANEKFAKTLKHFSEIGIDAQSAEFIFAWFLGETETTELTTRTANMIDRLKTLFLTGKGNEGKTTFDVFQAVTEYYTHESAGDSDDITKQFDSSEFGSGAEKKEKFFSALVDATSSSGKFSAAIRIGEKIMVAFNKAKIDNAKK